MAESKGVKIATGIVAPLIVVGVIISANGSNSDSSTVVKGRYHVDYVVIAPQGVHAPIMVTYTDPGSGDIKSITPDLPWAKDFDVTDPNALNARFSVDGSNNNTPLRCGVTVDGKVLVEKDIASGQSDSCAVLHF